MSNEDQTAAATASSSAPAVGPASETRASGGSGPPTAAAPSYRLSRIDEPERSEQSSLLGSEFSKLAEYGAFLRPTLAGSNGKPARSESTVRRKKERHDYLAYYLPILRWLPNYNFSLLTGDLLAGATLTALMVPQASAYAQSLAGIDPVHGLFGASIPSFLYALLGTCPQLSVGPEAGLSLLIGQVASDIASQLSKDSSEKHKSAVTLAVITMMTFQTGIITFILGILRLGFVDSVLSRPLLRGFISSMGLVILVNQLGPFFGLDNLQQETEGRQSSTVGKLVFVVTHLDSIHPLTVAVGSTALGILIAYRAIKPVIAKRFPSIRLVPEILLVVMGATALSSYFKWHERGLDVLGNVSAAHVKLHFPMNHKNWKYFSATLPTSVVMSALGFVDSVLAAKENASKYNYHLSPNRELVALGVSNTGAAFVSGTIPGFGSLTRSRINAQAGARTPMASLFMGTFMLLTTFFLMPLLYSLPKAILSSIIMLVVFSLISEAPEDIAFFLRLRAWSELGLMTVTALLTFFGSLELGLVVSVSLSLVMVVHRSSAMSIRIMGRNPTSSEWVEIRPGIDEENEEIPGILIARIRDSRMTFANAGALKERLRRLESYGAQELHPSFSPTRNATEVLILQMAQVDDIDPSALQILKETIENYVARNVKVYITHLDRESAARVEQAGIVEVIGEDGLQPTVKAALDHLQV